MTKVKICGLTNPEDALAAAEYGADLLGFIFYPPSPRSVTPARGRQIAEALRESGCRARRVGVFVNASSAEILETMAACDLDYAQLSGDETVGDLAALGDRGYKAIRPRSPVEAAALAAAFANPALSPALLVDAYDPLRYGGTGRPADPAAAAAAAAPGRNILLAGGLNPANIRAAIRALKPWGVDVASGVERAPGIKDHETLRTFIHNAKEDPHD